MTEYPDPAELLKRLEMCKVPDSFVEEAQKVCREALAAMSSNRMTNEDDPTFSKRINAAAMDGVRMAQLIFIKKVLGG